MALHLPAAHALYLDDQTRRLGFWLQDPMLGWSHDEAMCQDDPTHPQTVKLSPQPHMPLAFGLSKTKPAVKSSSFQSIRLPMR